MKIVFVINCLKVGGAAKMLKYVANIAVGIFDSVSVVDMYDDSYSSKELHHDIKVIGSPLSADINVMFFIPKVANLAITFTCPINEHT